MQKTSPHLFALLLLAALTCASSSAADRAELAPDALRADPWVVPPRTAEETQSRLAELQTQYAPYLRSLPEKLDVRQREELKGPWRSKFEICDSADGKRPEPPGWQLADFDDSPWETTPVPEWRWLPVRKGGRWYPASCILWYRTRFPAAPTPPGRRRFLCFAGVDWEAEVWLNGRFLGRHKTYYESFRFDVTSLLAEQNTLCVRVIEGPAFGEPMSQWSLLPFVPGDPGTQQRYVRGERARSFPGDKFGTTSSLGSGFGIHREVFLETTAAARVAEVFVRGEPSPGLARLSVETDAAAAAELSLEVRILPENFSGAAYEKTFRVRVPQGQGKHAIALPMPDARTWWPAEPCLYRCRVMLRDGPRLLDAHDVLFGCRSFGLVSALQPRPGLPEGQFLLNDRPVFLRGTNLSGALNAYWYWNQSEDLLRAVLLLKAANFNAVRTCQHVSFPEVRELFDRLGIMSEQDQGAGFEVQHDVAATLAETGTTLARTCYSNPGVVLLSFANETTIDATAVVRNALAVDPQRIIIPVSGGTFRLAEPRHRAHVLTDSHPYEGWYGGVHLLWDSGRTRVAAPMYTLGEYGAEALDAYSTMRDHYPRQWGPPPAPGDDKLWGARQVGTGGDFRQQFGFRGRKPANLEQYIEASQNYQADVLAEATKGIRLSKRGVAGYFQFHFLDGTAAQWPKSIVSHDFLPKRGYYEMAQVNQPLTPLYRLIDQGRTLEIWVANDLPLGLPGCKVRWAISAAQRRIEGEAPADVPGSEAVLCGKVDLSVLPAEEEVLQVALALDDPRGRRLSAYEREVYRSFKFVALGKQKAVESAVRRALLHKPNRALQKPATATSAGAETPAALGVDGGTRTGWTASDAKLPQSFTVDLGERTEIVGARLIWQGETERKIEIALSDDAQQWRPVAGKIQESKLLVPRAPLMFVDQHLLFGGAGRYLRVTITHVADGAPAGFNELEVYAK